MKRFLLAGVALALGASLACAQSPTANDTPVYTAPSFVSVLASSLKVTPPGQLQTTLAQALANATFPITGSPSIASGVGTSPSSPVQGSAGGIFTLNVGTGGSASSGVITMGTNPAPHGWVCSVVDTTNPGTSNTVATSSTTTTLTLTNYSRTKT